MATGGSSSAPLLEPRGGAASSCLEDEGGELQASEAEPGHGGGLGLLAAVGGPPSWRWMMFWLLLRPTRVTGAVSGKHGMYGPAGHCCCCSPGMASSPFSDLDRLTWNPNPPAPPLLPNMGNSRMPLLLPLLPLLLPLAACGCCVDASDLGRPGGTMGGCPAEALPLPAAARWGQRPPMGLGVCVCPAARPGASITSPLPCCSACWAKAGSTCPPCQVERLNVCGGPPGWAGVMAALPATDVAWYSECCGCGLPLPGREVRSLRSKELGRCMGLDRGYEGGMGVACSGPEEGEACSGPEEGDACSGPEEGCRARWGLGWLAAPGSLLGDLWAGAGGTQ